MLRRLAGWLCFLSLLVTIGYALFYAHLVMTPFFRGADVRYYHSDPDAGRLIAQLAQNGLDRSDAALLRGYANTVRPNWVRRAWDAIDMLVDTWKTTKFSRLDSGVIWAGVADSTGRVVARYPEEFDMSERIQAHTPEGWGGAVPLNMPTQGPPLVYPITDASGRQIGSLGLALVTSDRIAVIPHESEVRSYISPLAALWLAGLSFLTFLILLPTWVALDAEWRGMRSFAWAALIIITGPIGLAAYLIARLSPPRTCPNCGERVHAKYSRCPACGAELGNGHPVEQPDEVRPMSTPVETSTDIVPSPVTQRKSTMHMDIVLDERPGSISGRVLDRSTLSAIEGARVFVDSTRVDIGATTAAEGVFLIEDVPTGPYTIVAEARGYERQYRLAEVEPGKAVSLEFDLEVIPAEQENANAAY